MKSAASLIAKTHSRVARSVCTLAITAGISSFSMAADAQQSIELAPVEVIATSPGQGNEIARDKVPAFTQSVGAQEFARTNSPNVLDTLQQQVPGAVIDRYQRQ